jgi:hypothetical protein
MHWFWRLAADQESHLGGMQTSKLGGKNVRFKPTSGTFYLTLTIILRADHPSLIVPPVVFCSTHLINLKSLTNTLYHIVILVLRPYILRLHRE